MSKISKTLALATLLLLSACGKESWFGGEKKLDLPGERLPIGKDLLDATHKVNGTPHIHTHASNQNSDTGFTIDFNSYNSNMAWNGNAQPLLKFPTNSSELLNNAPSYVIYNDTIWYSVGDGTIKAYSLDTNEEKWSNEFYSIKFNNGFKALFADSPINIYMTIKDGVLYTVADIGYYASFDANTGELLATRTLSAPSRSVPNVTHNSVIIQTADGKVLALNFEDGNIIWTFDSAHVEMQSIEQTKLLSLGDNITAKFSNNEVVLINTNTGNEIWSLPLEQYGATRKTSRNMSNLNQVYAYQDHLYVVSNAGKLVKIDHKEPNIIYSKSYNIEGRLWIIDNAIFALTDTDDLLCINSNSGDLYWKIALRDIIVADDKEKIPEFMDPVVINGMVSILTSDGMLLNFNAKDGTLNSQVVIDTSMVLSSPSVYKDRLVVTAAKNGIVIY